MSGDRNSESSGEKEGGVAECPVCFSEFSNDPELCCSSEPKVLACGHSICEVCVQRVARKTSYQRWAECPLCRKQTRLPRLGALPTNFALLDTVREMRLHASPTEKKPPEEANEDSVTCANCNIYVQSKSGWVCRSCKTGVICANCGLKSHKSHEIQELGDVVKEFKSKVSDWLAELEPSVWRVCRNEEEVKEELLQLTGEVGNELSSPLLQMEDILSSHIRKTETLQEKIGNLRKLKEAELLGFVWNDSFTSVESLVADSTEKQRKIVKTVSEMRNLYKEIQKMVQSLAADI